MDYEQQLQRAIRSCDRDAVEAILQKSPPFSDRKDQHDMESETWLQFAVTKGGAEVVEALLNAGFNIDALRMPEETTALSVAIGRCNDGIIELLLRRGANPNLGRAIIAAVNERRTPEQRLKYIKLLLEHGADVNQLFDLYGDNDKQFTVLDWTSDADVIAYLREHGAKTADELKVDSVAKPLGRQIDTPSDIVIQYFEQHYGPVEKRAEIEVIPSGNSIAIHSIKPDKQKRPLTLFTTGLSNQPMATPPGEEQFALAEIFIQLPGDWKIGRDAPANQRWVTSWMRRIAEYPHSERTWLGGNFTVIDNEVPPQPLARGVSYTSWLLIAEETISSPDDRPINLYRMIPLWKQQRDLVFREGLGKLMQAFDNAHVPFIVDMYRNSVID